MGWCKVVGKNRGFKDRQLLLNFIVTHSREDSCKLEIVL